MTSKTRRWAAALAALAVIGGLAGCGSAAASGSSTSTPAASAPADTSACVDSRLANGDASVQAQNPELSRAQAETFCSYGSSFDSTTDTSLGVGPNTAG
jgi:hypothetical protein